MIELAVLARSRTAISRRRWWSVGKKEMYSRAGTRGIIEFCTRGVRR